MSPISAASASTSSLKCVRNKIQRSMQRKSFLRAAAAMAFTLSFTSCQWFSRPENKGDELSYKTAVYQDSLHVLDAHAYQSLSVDFPVEADTSLVAQRVLEWLCGEVSARCYPGWTDSTFVIVRAEDFEKGTADTSFGEAYLTYCGQQGMERMSTQLREEAADGFLGGYENWLEIKLVEKHDNYLTFRLTHDIYTGGAHGGSFLEGVTFCCDDASRMDWSIFDSEKRSELIEKLKPGLKKYFNQYEEEPVETDSALFECLLVFDDPDTPENELEFGVPLPHTDPWLTDEGIGFIYQEYEIAAYAYGRPVCIVPVEELEPLMTDAGRAWIRNALKTKKE